MRRVLGCKAVICLAFWVLWTVPDLSALGRKEIREPQMEPFGMEGAGSSRSSGLNLQKADDKSGDRARQDSGWQALSEVESVYKPGARDILMALTAVYPERVKDLQFLDGNWSVEVNGTRYFWMNGRMLSDEFRKYWSQYSSYYFRPYTGEAVPLRRYSKEEERRIRDWVNEREKKQMAVHSGFMRSLWGMESPEVAEQTVRKVRFLNRNIRFHPLVVVSLMAVKEEIAGLVQGDGSIRRWLAGMDYFGGYYWRKIAGSANRSMHSYGLAIDFIPKNYGGKHVYWRWSRDLEERWWAIPYSERYEVPLPVIRAFERHGFIWGGRWVLFDQIHFEYRPELILLGDMVKKRGREWRER